MDLHQRMRGVHFGRTLVVGIRKVVEGIGATLSREVRVEVSERCRVFE